MRTNEIRIALFLVAFVVFPKVTFGGETRLGAGLAFADSGMRDDPAQRKLVIDEAIQLATPARWNSSYPQADVLRESQATDLDVGARNAADFHVNPEPSSIMVWSAMLVSMAAAGYAYRRRLDSEAQVSVAC